MPIVEYDDAEGTFSIDLPSDWLASRDEEGGLLIESASGDGMLHLMPVHREPDEDSDPAEELYAFLAEQDIELEEDEVEDVDLPSGGYLAVCEYLGEDEEEGILYWLVAVATAPGHFLFANFSCPPEEGDSAGSQIRSILKSITF